MNPSLVVLTPVYEDAEASSRLFKELARSIGSDVHVVAVDDGSLHSPVRPEALMVAGLHGDILRLRRNMGHQRAIAIGLNFIAEHLSQAGAVVVMDSDGEDAPASIPTLIARLGGRDVDLVVAARKTRVESRKFKSLYWVYQRMFEVLVGRRIVFGNFMALTPLALQRLVAMSELWIHVPGCVLISRLRIVGCPLDRGSRYAGSSKMDFVGLALHGFRGLMVFSENVLVRMGVACAIVAGLATLGGIVAVAMKIAGYTSPGWSTVVLGVSLLLFLQMGALTLMMLMLTGTMRAGAATKPDYMDFVMERVSV